MNVVLSRRPAAFRTRGFTTVEIVIAVMLLTIGFLGFGSLFVMNARSWNLANEESRVLHALRDTAEMLRNKPFATIVSQYPDGFNFSMEEEKITIPVTVNYFLNETASSSEAAKLGLPRDLDGDGTANDTDVSANYKLLPIRIQASWTNLLGTHSEALYLLLAQEKT